MTRTGEGTRVCVMCHHPLPARRWWRPQGGPLCPRRAIGACQARFRVRVHALTLGLQDPAALPANEEPGEDP